MTNNVPRHQLEDTIRRYYAACNRGDHAGIVDCFTPDAIHYFPDGSPQGPFIGRDAIAQGWLTAVARLDSRWTVDHLVTDEVRAEVVIEWTHWKPGVDGYLRGSETCAFSPDGRISEIRAYYAAPPSAPRHELGGFDYEVRRFPLVPPVVDRDRPGEST